MVSLNVLVATISEGGVAIGAYDDGVLVGAVYGFATSDPAVHHSHYLAVDVPYRRQRARRGAEAPSAPSGAWPDGITAMRWTYDPLQYGNAHLNLRRLGALRDQLPRRPLRLARRDQRLAAERPGDGALGPRRSPARASTDERVVAGPGDHRRRHRRRGRRALDCPPRAARRAAAAARRRLAARRRRPRRARRTPSPADRRRATPRRSSPSPGRCSSPRSSRRSPGSASG